MRKERDYIQDISEIRSMMERSSRFLSLSGLAGVMAGIYALLGVYIAYHFFHFNPDQIGYTTEQSVPFSSDLPKIIILAILILLLAVGTAIFLSYKKARKRDEKVWNATSRRLLANMAVPLITGGILLLVLLVKGLIGLIVPLTLVFYGLALYNAGKFTYDDVKFLGMIQVGLGLLATCYIEYGLLFWAIGFGVVHIIYGIYMHLRYER
ncbi:MAG TPA: hypothetical protein VKA08_19530 [Balneolales bacterium]|nr:hypothetical protein [Balneolales bacterium]